MSSLSSRSILTDRNLVRDNFHDFYQTMRIVLMHEKLINTIDKSVVPKPNNNDDVEAVSEVHVEYDCSCGGHVLMMISFMEQLEKLDCKLGKELS
ncbi:hypothetical protein Lal_00018567 [Lupinus albus]|nr:hypothetical protein Lal_00018567 [Lupinus albus]